MAANHEAAVKFSSLFGTDEIACGLESRARDGAIGELVDRLVKSGAVTDGDEVVKVVVDRERLSPTQLVPGLAVPHARLDDIRRVSVAVGTSREGVDFGRGLDNPAYVVVLILTPADAPATYLQTLAAVARIFSKGESIGALRRLETAQQVWEYFEGGPTTLPSVVTAGDMMASDYVTLRNTDRLARAIDLFCRHRAIDIPVMDDEGDLVGIMTEKEVLKLALPEYLLWLDDLKPILHLEPFVEILKNEHVLRVAEVMSKDYVTVTEDVPAIEVARVLMTSGASQVLVVREHRLVGVIALGDFLARVLRK